MKDLTAYNSIKPFAQCRKDDTALFYLGTRLSFSCLLDKVDKLAFGLFKLGLKEGDTITLALPNIPETALAFYASSKIGLISSIIHPLLPCGEIVKTMLKTKSHVLFILDDVYLQNKEFFDSQNINIILCSVANFLPLHLKTLYRLKNAKILNKTKDNKKFSSLLINGKTQTVSDNTLPSIYLHSGGTTGDPKTIMLSAKNLNTLAFAVPEMLSTSKTRHRGRLAVLPMFHVFGLAMGVHSPLANGFATALVPTFNKSMIVSTMNKIDISVITGVPTMYEKLITYDKFANNKKLKNLLVAFSGGDTLNPSLKERFDSLLKNANSCGSLFEGYGLTETSSVACVNTKTQSKANSIGKPLSICQIKILDENFSEVPRGALGQIAVKSDTTMLGYLDDLTSTQKAKADDFILTGDCGFMDEEGFVFFKQRIKRIIKVSGVGVFPSEIESAVDLLPFIKMSTAIGVNNVTTGSEVKLFVVLDKNMAKNENTKQLIYDHLKQYLVKWSMPKQICFCDSLPLTLVGKVDFKQLEKQENS